MNFTKIYQNHLAIDGNRSKIHPDRAAIDQVRHQVKTRTGSVVENEIFVGTLGMWNVSTPHI
jgi:hypothetical protein